MLCFLLLNYVVPVSATGDVYGQVFVIAFPHFTTWSRAIYLSLYTLAHYEIKVNVTLNWNKDNLTSALVVSRLNPLFYHLAEEKRAASVKVRDVYRLASSEKFTLTVYVTSNNRSVESMQALPCEGWGTRYFTHTVRKPLYVILVTQELNRVSVTFTAVDDPEFVVRFQGMDYGNSDYLDVGLLRYESYTVYLCNETKYYFGLDITAHNFPIGVITGFCPVSTGFPSCVEQTAIERIKLENFAMEMLFPFQSFGTEFFIFWLDSDYMKGVLLVSAPLPKTQITEYSVYGTSAPYDVTPSKTVNMSSPAKILKSNNPIQVIFVRNIFCSKLSTSISSYNTLITDILPTTLFLNAYYWSTPNSTMNLKYHFAVIVCRHQDFDKGIYLDRQLLKNYKAVKLKGPDSTDWTYSINSLRPGTHDLYANSSSKVGLYVYGVNELYGYMHPVGFIAASLNPSTCDKRMTKGDHIDNDCDQRVDEEVRDNIDNDMDGRVDEDLAFPSPSNGSWGGWSEWMCADCDGSTTHRSRMCDNPAPVYTGYYCDGQNRETIEGNCSALCRNASLKATTTVTSLRFETADPNKSSTVTVQGQITLSVTTSVYVRRTTPELFKDGVWSGWTDWECSLDCKDARMIRIRSCEVIFDLEPNTSLCVGQPVMHKPGHCTSICPEDCPVGKWGSNCAGQCEHCDPDCNKRNGTCTVCRPGYHYPHLSCSKRCEKYTFGDMCRGNCIERCGGEDCMERVLGICPPKNSIPSAYWLLLLIIPVSLLLVLRHRHATAPPAIKKESMLSQAPSKSPSSIKSSQKSSHSLVKETSLGKSSSHIAQTKQPYKFMYKPTVKYSMDNTKDDSGDRLYNYDQIYGTFV
ncbi:uncharacterized protein LOC106070401 [Biomphalaria glabrata]|uniref:Uncharacterized protein LOC106070401 n=1 Tax=Biomphalaria glabrata TaxID=6526 RepID=A0A9W2ZFN6_BIOGL|nr:uncharacterized protein LOC106070401 [Biomphalaria glabrata]